MAGDPFAVEMMAPPQGDLIDRLCGPLPTVTETPAPAPDAPAAPVAAPSAPAAPAAPATPAAATPPAAPFQAQPQHVPHDVLAQSLRSANVTVFGVPAD